MLNTWRTRTAYTLRSTGLQRKFRSRLQCALVHAKPIPHGVFRMTIGNAQQEWAYVAGVQAFIYGYPLVEIVRTCALMTAVGEAQTNGRAPINQFSHCPRPWTHEDRDVVT